MPPVEFLIPSRIFSDDPRHPVILGSMYSSKNTPHEMHLPMNDENDLKAIVTKKGTMICFSDEDEGVMILTPKGNEMTLEDSKQSIEVTDQHGNSITLDNNGIAIKSAKDLKIEASGSVEITGQKVDVK